MYRLQKQKLLGLTVHWTLHAALCILYNTHWTAYFSLHTAHCTVHLTMHSFSLKLCSATSDLKHLALYTAHYMLQTVHCTLITTHTHCAYTLEAAHGTLYTSHCTLHTVHCTVYTASYTLGQYWLTSWGYKTSLPIDNDKLVRLGRQAVEVGQTEGSRQ